MRVIYLCPWTSESGGIQVLYEHVRLLRKNGIDALLGAPEQFQRCTWFDNDPKKAPGIDNVFAQLRDDDVLVVPEICVGAELLDNVAATRIALVQNPDLLTAPLDEYAATIVPTPVLKPWLEGVAGGAAPIHVVPGFLHNTLVRAPRRFTRNRPRALIVDRPSKHRGEPVRMRDRLTADAVMDITYIDQAMSRDRFTDLFRQHDIYLHLSYPEGFPISVMEAFGAGCLVVGFSGRGGLEFMRNGQNCWVAPDGDFDGALTQLHNALDSSKDERDAMLMAARATATAYPEHDTATALHTVLRQLHLEEVR